MARSRRKTPIFGMTTAESEKADKVMAHRKLRRVEHIAVRIGSDMVPNLRDVSNVWAFDKDGKRYRSRVSDKDMRK